MEPIELARRQTRMVYRRSAVVALLLLTGCAQQERSVTARSSPTAPTVATRSSPAPEPPALSAPYLVGAPLLGAPSGPGMVEKRPCRPQMVTATAVTKLIVDGVAGVIRLKGDNCSLFISEGPTALLDSAGHRLTVALDAAEPKVNPPQNIRPDLALYWGQATWGFTWTGSWCGSRAAEVLVPMNGDPNGGEPRGPYGDLHVPLSGPPPGCHGPSASVLRPGIAGTGAEPVLPPSPSWSALQASVTIPATVSSSIPPYTVTLRNPTAMPITLSPCPEVGVMVGVSRAGPGEPSASDAFGPAKVRCPARSVIAPHGSLTLTVAASDLDAGKPRPYPSGSLVTVEVAIAGVATAKAVAHVG